MAADKDQARELELYVMNTYPLYEQLMAFNNNYSLKKKKGIFDKTKAIKGLLNVVKSAITRYNKEFGSIGVVNSETKNLVAKELFDTLWFDYGLSNVRKAKVVKRKK